MITMSQLLPLFLVISVLSLHKIALTLMSSQRRCFEEHFLTDGEWIMRHVDPRFQTGGLLIPVVSQPVSPPRLDLSEKYVDDDSDDDLGVGFIDLARPPPGGAMSEMRPRRRRRRQKKQKTTKVIMNPAVGQGSSAQQMIQQPEPISADSGATATGAATDGAADSGAADSTSSVVPKAQPAANNADGGSNEKANEGSGYAGKNNAGGFAGKPYCGEYKPSEPLPFFYNQLAIDGTLGGIASRGPVLAANKMKLNNEMKAQNVPDELRPLLMAFAMMETDDFSLDQISEFTKSKTMATGRSFGIFNVNFGHRSHLKLDGEMSNEELDGLTDKYYAGTDKENAEKIIMRESVKVFNASFAKLGIYCTILFHRGGSTLFNDNALSAHKDWHPQIFFDSVANTYNAIVKDMTLMTDDRRVWFDVKEV
jgi:hypothetical protein